MAATIPTGYQNKGNGIWIKDIEIKGKKFTVEVDPTTEQKWIYEKDFYGNGQPLLTITNTNPNGTTNGDFSYSTRKNDLTAAGISADLLTTSLKQETTWANVQGTQSTPPSRDDGNQRSEPNSADAGTQPPQDPEFKGIGPLDEKSFTEDAFRNYKYPISMNALQDRILIQQLKYVRSDVIQNESNFSSANGNTKLKTLGSVTLPVPNDISESNNVGWGEDSLSNIAAAAMGPLSNMVAGTAEGDLGQIPKGVGELVKVFTNAAVGTRAKQFLTTRAAASLVGKIGINVNPEAYITRVTGAAINPNLELLFNGPKLRSFAFQFKMSPRNQSEAAEIRRILKFFKKGMAPKRSLIEESAFFLGTPNVFKLKFMSGENELKSIGKFKTCALVGFNANYTPDGFYAAFNDSSANGSQPVSVTMQLSFTELTPIFNDEYDNDPESDDVGPNTFTYESPLKTEPTETPPPTDNAEPTNPSRQSGVPSPDGRTNRPGGR